MERGQSAKVGHTDDNAVVKIVFAESETSTAPHSAPVAMFLGITPRVNLAVVDLSASSSSIETASWGC